MNFEWAINRGAKLLGQFPFEATKRKSHQLGEPMSVTHFQFPFRQWDGVIGEWKEHFGKGRGQVYSLDGSEPVRSCNEVEVAKILGSVRDHAFWFSAYNTTNMPDIWRPWVRSMSELPDWLQSLDSKIRQKINSDAGGIPDVVAWNDKDSVSSAIFVECKGRKESFRESQEDWLGTAISEGIIISQFGVSIRPF